MRRFGICSAVLVLACVAVVTAATKKYVNSTYGFSTELPDTWVSLSQKPARSQLNQRRSNPPLSSQRPS